MYNITLLDRMIINSVSKKNRNIQAIATDTNLSCDIIKIVLEDLLIKNIFTLKASEYFINQYLNTDQVKGINSKDSIDVEKIQIAKSALKKEAGFNLEKFALSKKDEVIFEGMLKSLKMFIDSSKIKDATTKEENLFFWGQNNYSDIVNSTLY